MNSWTLRKPSFSFKRLLEILDGVFLRQCSGDRDRISGKHAEGRRRHTCEGSTGQEPSWGGGMGPELHGGLHQGRAEECRQHQARCEAPACPAQYCLQARPSLVVISGYYPDLAPPARRRIPPSRGSKTTRCPGTKSSDCEPFSLLDVRCFLLLIQVKVSAMSREPNRICILDCLSTVSPFSSS